jgi:hypothetical protein
MGKYKRVREVMDSPIETVAKGEELRFFLLIDFLGCVPS